MWYTVSILLLTVILYMVPILVLLPFRLSLPKFMGLLGVVAANIIWMTFVVNNYGIFIFLATGAAYIACIEQHRCRNICLFVISYLMNVVLNNMESTLLWMVSGIDIPTMQARPVIYLLFFISSISISYFVSKFLVFLYHKFAYHFDVQSFPKRLWFFICINLVLTAVMYAVNIIEGGEIGYSSGVVMFNTMVFTVYFGITTWLIFSSVRNYKEQSEMQMRQASFEAMQKYTEQVENLYNNVRSFKHDYVNILTTMCGYIDDKDIDGLDTYFHGHILPLTRQLAPANYQIGRLANLKVLELKSLATAKLIYAQEMGIEVLVEADTPVESVQGDIIDIVRILGIFLDNAIEAALETKGPRLSLVVIVAEQEVAFKISNSFIDHDMNLLELAKPGVTTKGAGRGIGLYNAAKLAARNRNMYFDTSVENENFVQLFHIYNQA